jgi:hypothetical protein
MDKKVTNEKICYSAKSYVTFGGYANFRKRCAAKHKRFDLKNI